ncbi:MAG TPA: 30S ribosomal protein S20 [Patescibacteria group bacterium]|nr:30S ribosomal protein S20 [Patescibacteria group bacterium]
MPQLKQSAKRFRQSVKKAAVNKKVKDGIDYLERQFKKALDSSEMDKAKGLSRQLIKAIDKAKEKHIYHQNNAARKKSRMMKKVNALSAKK